MKTWKKQFALFLVPALLLAFAGCDREQTPGGGGETPPPGGDPAYKDTVERPEIEMPEPALQVVYPAKPAQKPALPAEGTVPSVKRYVASEAANPYAVTEKDGEAEISYTDVSDWAYVYAEVENYSPEYGNFKITLNNGAPAAERVAVQAIYYEAYELGYSPAVTVYLGELAEGEQYVIGELGEHLITDAAYNKVSGQSVKDKTVLGFVLFFDSLPSFAPPTDATGKIDVVGFELLKDGDPKLEDRYVKPETDFAEATADEGTSAAVREGKLAVSGNGSAYLPIRKYSADFTAFKLEFVKQTDFEVSVRYRMDGRTLLSAPEQVTADGEFTYDFTDLRPTDGGDDLTTQWIRNAEVTDIVITPLTAGKEVLISGVSFLRTATDGAYVANVWSSSTSDVTIVRAANGGNAKLEYSYYTAWNNFTVPVRKGDGIRRIRLTVYAPDGLTHLGVGLTNSSSQSSNGQAMGSYILRGSSYLFNGAESDTVGEIGETEPNLTGMKETVSYLAETKTYVLEYDFTSMKPDASGKTFADYTISSLIFYLNCPDTADVAAEHEFDGVRRLYFLSIDLLKD